MSTDQNQRIEDKIDKISERLNSIDVTLAQQAVQLTHHIKRTDLLEDKLSFGKIVAMGAAVAAIIKLFV